jgi:hypothetical protein
MKKESRLGYYLVGSIAILFVVAVIGGIVEMYNSNGSVTDALTSDYYRMERSRIVKESKTYIVTKLNYEKDKALTIDFDTYYVTMKDDDGKVQTITVDSKTYYSLNVGDSVNYKGQPVSSSEE